MMGKRLLILAGFFLVGPLYFSEAAAQKKQTAASKKTSTAKKNSSTSKKTGRSSSVSSKKHGRKTARRTPRGQLQPTPNRYREIQQALADRGYFKPEPDGVWGPESVEALKQFQQDQDLRPSGRLDPMSLISLGLGPKREDTPPEKTAEP
jgi:peptidoglycan hydrolase-like protein with peptidoglycan-binding domain